MTGMLLPKFATVGLTPIPIRVVQLVTQKVFDAVLARHPTLFDRLGPYAEKRYGFDPVDLPFVFEVLPDGPTIRVLRKGVVSTPDAMVTGPFIMLLALLEGRLDGDAVFFSRELEVSGDTEAILALRNALDDCVLDLPTDIAAIAGPFRLPVQRFFEFMREWLLAEKDRVWN
uniref:ubiquinone anaerobic biosynthesis accessory factor UbiT n=1 Tax=Pararhizobium sp. IMCC3301 TaxID=3067904 RepID=UPI002741BD98|nr:SCP2 sterol-binding domain-containing protein [Pararhizobium sp. IMCC3301]